MLTNNSDADAGVIFLVSLVISFLIFGIPVMKILHKAGYSRAWVLVMLVPLLNIIMLWVFAFARWPALAAGYGYAGGAPGYGQPPYPQGQQPYPPQGGYPQSAYQPQSYPQGQQPQGQPPYQNYQNPPR